MLSPPRTAEDVPIRRQPHTKQGRVLFIAAEQRSPMLRCFSRPQGVFWGEDALSRSLAGARLRAIISPPLTGCAHHPIQNLRLFRPLAGRRIIKAAAPQKAAAQSGVPIRRQPHTKQGRMLFIAAEQRVCWQPHTERSRVWGQRYIQPSEFRRNGFNNVAPPKLNIYKPSPSPHSAKRFVWGSQPKRCSAARRVRCSHAQADVAESTSPLIL